MCVWIHEVLGKSQYWLGDCSSHLLELQEASPPRLLRFQCLPADQDDPVIGFALQPHFPSQWRHKKNKTGAAVFPCHPSEPVKTHFCEGGVGAHAAEWTGGAHQRWEQTLTHSQRHGPVEQSIHHETVLVPLEPVGFLIWTWQQKERFSIFYINCINRSPSFSNLKYYKIILLKKEQN